jgi:chaperone modulatory protein CbpM
MTQEMLTLTGIVLDDELSISLRELCQVCGVTAERIMDMVEEGVVDPRGASPREWHFGGKAVVRAQVALRLQRDLRVNLAGAALILDLLEELEELRRRHGRYNM